MICGRPPYLKPLAMIAVALMVGLAGCGYLTRAPADIEHASTVSRKELFATVPHDPAEMRSYEHGPPHLSYCGSDGKFHYFHYVCNHSFNMYDRDELFYRVAMDGMTMHPVMAIGAPERPLGPEDADWPSDQEWNVWDGGVDKSTRR